MKILERIRCYHGVPGYLNVQADWVKENGRIYVSVDDLIDTMKELKKLNLTESASIQVENIQSGLQFLKNNAGKMNEM